MCYVDILQIQVFVNSFEQGNIMFMKNIDVSLYVVGFELEYNGPYVTHISPCSSLVVPLFADIIVEDNVEEGCCMCFVQHTLHNRLSKACATWCD